MATDLERLVVQLSADVKQYNNALNKALGTTNRQARAMESRFAQMNRRIGTSLAGIGKGFAIGLASSLTLRGMQSLSDAATKVDNSLKVTGLSGENLEKVYNSLRDSAVKNGAPLETLAELYSRASMAAENLGASQSQLLKFSDAVAVSLRVSGKSAEEAGGALLQLGQLLSGNVVQAQEYNSLIDGAYPLLQAVAAGLKEAGGDVGKLTQLVKSGQVPVKAFFDAFLVGSDTLTDKVATAQFTVSQSLENLRTGLIDVAREFNKSTGASERFAGGINTVAKAVADFDVSGFIQKIEDAQASLQGLLSDLGNSSFFTKLNQALGITDSKGNMVPLDTKEAQDKAATLEREVKILQDTIAKNTELGFSNKDALAQLAQVQAALAGVRGQLATLPGSAPGANIRSPEDLINSQVPFSPLSPITTKGAVSLKDYPSTSKKKKGRTHGIKKTADDAFNEDIQGIKDRTAALAQEQAGLRLSFYEQQKRETSLKLEQQALKDVQEAARKKGDVDWKNAQLSPDQIKQIDEVSAAYARQADDLRKAQAVFDLQRDVVKGVFDDFRSALEDGKLDWKDFSNIALNALNKIVDKIENDLIDAIFSANSAMGGGGGGGLLSGFLSLLGIGGGGGGGVSSWTTGAFDTSAPRFANGTNFAPGGPSIINEQGGEIVDLPRGSRVIPHDVSMAMAKAGSGSTSITYAPTIDARGADSAAVARIQDTLARDKAEFSVKVLAAVRKAKKSNEKGI